MSFFEDLFNFIDIYHQKRISNYYKKFEVDFLVDCGAHKGEFTKFNLSKNYTKYFLIEPNKEIFLHLKKELKKNYNIKFFNLAVSNKKGFAKFYINHLSSTSSLIEPDKNQLYTKIKKVLLGNKLIKKIKLVPINTLDNILFNDLKNLNKGILKIDVEGNEYKVLKGSKKILQSKKINIIQLERLSRSSNINNKKIEILLKKYNYRLVKKFIYPLFHFSDDIYINF